MSYLRVEVVWTDSGIINEAGNFNDSKTWKSKEEILSKLTLVDVITTGILIHEDEDTVFIALSHDPLNDHFYGVQGIAKKNIKEMIRLRAR